jgi:nicotinamidase-related amidase
MSRVSDLNGSDAIPQARYPASARPSLAAMARTALMVIDMLNGYDHEDADRLAGNVEPIVPKIRELRGRAAESDDALVLCVNDNWGGWHADRDELVRSTLQGKRPDLVGPIVPANEDLFVIKGRHSVFFQTPVDYILDQYAVERVVMVGQVTEQCILYSALDAHLRHLPTVVVTDAVAAIHDDLADAALRMMERNMKVELQAADDLSF